MMNRVYHDHNGGFRPLSRGLSIPSYLIVVPAEFAMFPSPESGIINSFSLEQGEGADATQFPSPESGIINSFY